MRLFWRLFNYRVTRMFLSIGFVRFIRSILFNVFSTGGHFFGVFSFARSRRVAGGLRLLSVPLFGVRTSFGKTSKRTVVFLSFRFEQFAMVPVPITGMLFPSFVCTFPVFVNRIMLFCFFAHFSVGGQRRRRIARLFHDRVLVDLVGG